MHPEIIRPEDIEPPSDTYPWQKSERDNWYAVRVQTEKGLGLMRVKRTAHAAALGRAILADRRRQGEVFAVAVFEYDQDADTWPGITPDGDLTETSLHAPLAVITDPAPVGADVEALERDIEAAQMAKRRWEQAQARATATMQALHARRRRGPDRLTANTLAAMMHGILSRPTVLKALRIPEQHADRY